MAAWSDLHGAPPLRYKVRESRKNWAWVLGVPLVALGLMLPTHKISLLLFGAYGVLGWKIYRDRVRRGDNSENARLYALFCVLGKIPESLGRIQYWITKLRGQRATLIEYKS
jgi:hypothetical protein